jgi:hypothetical protein
MTLGQMPSPGTDGFARVLLDTNDIEVSNIEKSRRLALRGVLLANTSRYLELESSPYSLQTLLQGYSQSWRR